MKPQDWFGVGIRFAGVWCGIQAALNLMYFLDMRLGFAQLRGPAPTSQDYGNPVGYLIYAAGHAILAAYFLLGAGHLTALTFGRADPALDADASGEESLHPDEETPGTEEPPPPQTGHSG